MRACCLCRPVCRSVLEAAAAEADKRGAAVETLERKFRTYWREAGLGTAAECDAKIQAARNLPDAAEGTELEAFAAAVTAHREAEATLVLLRPQSLTGANPSILNLFARLVQACLPCSVDSVHHVSCYYIYFHVRAAVDCRTILIAAKPRATCRPEQTAPLLDTIL